MPRSSIMKRTSLFFRVLFFSVILNSSLQAQTVIINEVFSRGVAGDLDWIELYNPLSVSVDISGYKIYDTGAKGGTKSKKIFPDGTVLPAKGFISIIVDTAAFAGDTSGFGISNSGETVWLENSAGTVIDTCAIAALGTDTSYARIPDAGNAWRKISPRTKGKTNIAVKMNEIYSRGVAGTLDWIEVHNNTAAAIDISGYKIYDSGGQTGTKSKKLFPAGTIVPANGFTVIIVDTATFAGDTSGFGISNNGETVWLENAAGLTIDTVAIPALGNDTSYARVPDGSNLLMKRAPVSKGSTNGTLVSVASANTAAREYSLQQNFPNPFNPSTTIRFRMAAAGVVKLAVYDLLGNQVALLINGNVGADEQNVQFKASALSSGVYFYQLTAGKYSEMKKMLLVK